MISTTDRHTLGRERINVVRDIKRIDRITKLINVIWREQPDVCFGQLIHNLESDYNEQNNGELSKEVYNKEKFKGITSYTKTYIIDAFYLEDDKLEKFLESKLNKN